jgi:hypothetical protein
MMRDEDPKQLLRDVVTAENKLTAQLAELLKDMEVEG